MEVFLSKSQDTAYFNDFTIFSQPKRDSCRVEEFSMRSLRELRDSHF